VVRRIRFLIFLKDVFFLAVTSWGGPHVHIALFLERLVEKRKYLSEEELLELYALCQILPGPTSTQTLTAIGFKVGGPKLAFLTLLVWILPAVTIMTLAAVAFLWESNQGINFTKYVQPMAVAFVAFAAYIIISKVIETKTSILLMILAAIVSYLIRSPYLPPIILLLGGMATTFRFRKHPKEPREDFNIEWSNFILWAAVFIGAAVLGALTHFLPIRLFENFYRNGSLIFGGGQVLIPLMYTEFVTFKHYLTSEEFLSGLALAQVVPGPVFAFSSYIGVLSMRNFGIGGELLGGFISAAGIFLPGTFLIFFVIRFWYNLKKFRFVKASLEGINAVSAGLVASAAVLIFEPIPVDIPNISIIVVTFTLLVFTKIPPPLLILLGFIGGVLF